MQLFHSTGLLLYTITFPNHPHRRDADTFSWTHFHRFPSINDIKHPTNNFLHHRRQGTELSADYHIRRMNACLPILLMALLLLFRHHQPTRQTDRHQHAEARPRSVCAFVVGSFVRPFVRSFGRSFVRLVTANCESQRASNRR